MRIRIAAALVGALLLLVGIVGAKPKPVTGHENVCVVFALPPTVTIERVGTTVFQNKGGEEDIGFRSGAVAMEHASAGLLHPARILASDAPELAAAFPDGAIDLSKSTKDLAPRFADACASLNADVLVFIGTLRSGDWMQHTTVGVSGVGFRVRDIAGLRHAQCYAALQMRVFERQSGRFIAHETVRWNQQVPRISWRGSWSEQTKVEQRQILRGFDVVVRDATASALSAVGLMKEPAPLPKNDLFINRRAQGKSWIPEGNDLPVPTDLTPEQVRYAIASAMSKRGWQVTTNSPTGLVGTIREGNKEATATATIQSDRVVLTPARHRIKADNSREPLEPQLRWHRNLKATILQELDGLAAELSAESDTERSE